MEYYVVVEKLVFGLLELGVQKGDFVGVIGENCLNWFYIDMVI